MTIRRTDAEIAMRVAGLTNDIRVLRDVVEGEIEELLFALPYREAKLYLPDSTTEAEWTGNQENTPPINERAKKHLGYVIQSAVQGKEDLVKRGVARFRAWTWLLEPELYLGVVAAPAGTMGMGTLRAAANALGLSEGWEIDSASLPTVRLMADGLLA